MGYKPEYSYNSLVDQQADYFSYLLKFIQTTGIEFWNMAPDNSVINNGKCLVKSGNEYLCYSVNGGSFTINLPQLDFNAVWYNPKTGNSQSAGTITGLTTLTAPFNGDAALYLKKS